jgi:hypothetical protein
VGKITLVTPPDFYENQNFSILMIGLSDSEQDKTSVWLGQSNITQDINLYYYQGEDSIEWLLYAIARADATYINADTDQLLPTQFLSYFISRPSVFYNTYDENKNKLFSCLSNRYVNTIEDFLKGILSD